MSSPGIEPGPRPSQGRMPSGTPQGRVRDAGGTRTHSRPLCRRRPDLQSASSERPRQESNLVPDLRRVVCGSGTPRGRTSEYPDLESNQDRGVRTASCCPLHHRDTKSRRPDSHRHPPPYEGGAFLGRATSAYSSSGRNRTHILGVGNRYLAVRRHCCQGVRGELNPPLRLSQSRVPDHYTTNTVIVSPRPGSPGRGECCSGRSGSRTRKAVSGLGRLPTGSRRLSGGPSVSSPGWTRTTDLPHVKGTFYLWTTGLCSAPRPGVEPGTSRSKRDMMSVSSPGRERKVRESNPHPRIGEPR